MSLDPGERLKISEENTSKFSLAEARETRLRLATRKAPGPGWIPPEVVRLLGRRHPDSLRNLPNRLLREKPFRKAQKSLVPITKQGALFGSICQLHIVWEVLERMSAKRLTEEIGSAVTPAQAPCGLRRGRPTMEVLTAVIGTAQQETLRDRRTRRHVLLILFDFGNAFSSVDYKRSQWKQRPRKATPLTSDV